MIYFILLIAASANVCALHAPLGRSFMSKQGPSSAISSLNIPWNWNNPHSEEFNNHPHVNGYAVASSGIHSQGKGSTGTPKVYFSGLFFDQNSTCTGSDSVIQAFYHNCFSHYDSYYNVTTSSIQFIEVINDTSAMFFSNYWNSADCVGIPVVSYNYTDGLDNCRDVSASTTLPNNYLINWSPLKPNPPIDYSTGRLELYHYSGATDCLSNKGPLTAYYMESTATNICVANNPAYTVGLYANATMLTCNDKGWTITTYNSLTSCTGEVSIVYTGNLTSGCTEAGYFPNIGYLGYSSFRCIPPTKSSAKKQNPSFKLKKKGKAVAAVVRE